MTQQCNKKYEWSYKGRILPNDLALEYLLEIAEGITEYRQAIDAQFAEYEKEMA